MFDFFGNLSTLQKGLITAIVAIILFFCAAGISFSYFSKSALQVQQSHTTTSVASINGENPNEPRTEACPLNGSMHTKEAKDAWTQRRPLAVMIENSIDARPQSGLSYADVVYETVAEGGITRFMAVFLCNPVDVEVGPVRSARTYFIDWLSEYDALYAHVGGANCDKNTGSGCGNGGKADALGQIIKYGIKDLNQFYIGFPVYWRDYQRLGHDVATEHTMYSSTQKLWDEGVKRGWGPTDDNGQRWDVNFVAWKFKDDGNTKGADATKINVSFWDNQPNYDVTWVYDAGCNCYNRFQNKTTPHMDLDVNKQLTTKNIVIQFEKESAANDGYPGNVHQLFGTIGKGDAWFFMDGKVIKGSWEKDSRTSRSKYFDQNGKEISFDRGVIWIQTVSLESTVTY